MIVTCPACSVRYVAEAAAFPPEGRILRCSACGHSWRQKPVAVAAPTPAVAAVVAPPAQAVAAAAASVTPAVAAAAPPVLAPIAPLDLQGDNEFNPNAPSPLLFGWVALLLLILLLGGAAYFMRDAVRERFPSTRAVYNVVLANDETKQLIDAPQVQRLDDKGAITLVVKGQVRNNDTAAATPYPIDVQVLGTNGVTLSTQQFNDYPLKSLLPKSSIPFEVRINNVAPDAAEVKITVVKPAATAPAPAAPAVAEPVALPSEAVKAEPVKAPEVVKVEPAKAEPVKAPEAAKPEPVKTETTIPAPVELDTKAPTTLMPATPLSPSAAPKP